VSSVPKSPSKRSRYSEEGVRVGHQSVSEFLPPFTIVGNGGASVSCDTTLARVRDLIAVLRSKSLARPGAEG
jgi:hypothetical protein